MTGSGHAPVAAPAARLATLAGIDGSVARPSVERLEPRQMLFSLTITPDLANGDGLGTAEAVFAYALPVLLTGEDVGENEVEVRVENFDEEALGAIGSGRVFAGEGLVTFHSIANPGANYRMIADLDNQGQVVDGTERIQARPRNGESYRFRFLVDETQGPNGQRVAVTDFTIVVGAAPGTNQGLTPESTIVRLRLGGQVVAEFDTAAEIQGAKIAGANTNGVGTYRFTTGDPLFPAFDEIEFLSTSNSTPAYTVDDISWSVPPGNFEAIVSSRIFGAVVSFTGPVGSSVQILDLYGRDMVLTTLLGVIGDLQVPRVDPDDNGIPNFNDGIGQIRFSGTDSRAAFRMWGLELEEGYSDDAFWNEGPFGGGRPEDFPEPADDDGYVSARLVSSFTGLYDQFEQAGFGFAATGEDGGTGLPAVGGSVIVGSPIVRPLASYNPQGTPQGAGSVSPFQIDASINPTQGIFLLDGSSMGQISIHGALYGSSRFEGAVESINVGTLFGSITVEGDLKDLWVATDAGLWAVDPDFPTPPNDPASKTGGQLVVGRTLGNISVAGRSALDVTVIGDVANPQQRPPLDQFVHAERESYWRFGGAGYEFGVDENAQYDEGDFIRDLIPSPNAARFLTPLPAPIFFGVNMYRNDLISAAEWIGNTGTSVRVDGTLGFGDPGVYDSDPGDVFAFAVDGSGQVVIELAPVGGQVDPDLTVRIVDQRGNTVAANNQPRLANFDPRVIFTPNAPGVYYAIVQIAPTDDVDTDQGSFYSILFSGIAPATLGNHMSGAASGGVVDDATSTINVLAGNLGFFRSGMAFLDGTGSEVAPNAVTNSDDGLEVLLTTRAISLSVSNGDLFTFMTGSDVEGADPATLVTIFVSGDLGSFVTGQATIIGLSSELGDVELTSLEVGGRVGTVDIRGRVGESVDGGTAGGPAAIGLRFRSGTGGGNGDVGVFRVGDDIWGPTSSFEVSPGSTVGMFLVSQDNGAAGQGIFGPTPRNGFFVTGVGSDVRFVDVPNIDLIGGVNTGLALRAGVPLEIFDDGGASVRLTVTGAGPVGLPVGFLRFIPIDGSEGVALGRIDGLDLTGRSLLIETLGTPTDGRVSIGRINLIGADAATNITITGNIGLDIWQLVQQGGDAFGTFSNDTPGGDIVAMDVVGINTIDIANGNLGRTEMPQWGPQLIGPNLGLARGLQGEVGGALGISAAAMDLDWGGNAFRPSTNTNTNTGTAFLDDIGAPIDGYLDGIVVRTGNVASIRVGGQVGDVILQGGNTATLTELAVNTDNATPIGQFHGIVGSIYAPNINRVEVGDGLRGDRYSPFASGSIMADNQIIEVTAGTATRSADIRGPIWAANAANTVNPVGTPAVGRLFVNGGDYVNASIGAGLMDGFWLSVNYNDEQIATGVVDRVTGQGANFFRSEVFASVVNTMTLTDGFFDASSFNAQVSAGTITALGYRNSTLAGTNLEYRPSTILIGGDLGSLQTQTLTGDIRDTLVDVVGSVTTGVTAGFITRSEFQVDNELPALTVADSIRGSKFVFGRLEIATVGDSIRHSEFRGNQILSITAADSITNVAFVASGPNGRIDTVTALNTIIGSFTASGPIASITTTTGDLDAKITTTTRRGTVGTLSAGRDLIIDSDISRGIAALNAGRHVGSLADPTVIRLRGNLTTLTAPNGQLYSDVRVGQDVTGPVTLGPALSRPGNNQVGSGSLIAFGRIASVAITGDFGGSIISYTGGIGSVVITNGSFLRGNTNAPNIIAAYDGDVTSLVINNGNLYGDVYADYNLVSLQVNAGADGVFGDVGVNPAFNASTGYDNFRNTLPPGTAPSSAVQGPRIAAGRNIVNVAVTGGSVFESTFWAGRAIQTIAIAGDLRNDGATSGFGSWIAAGDTIASLTIGGSLRNAVIAAGVLDDGEDRLPGGQDEDSDIVQAGSVATINVGGDASGSLVLAGVLAGNDGVYGTSDDRAALGVSTIGAVNIAGAASDVTLRSDVVATTSKPGVIVNGGSLKVEDTLVAKDNPSGTEFTGSIDVNLGDGSRATVALSGPGRAFWNNTTKTLSLVNTTLASALTVTATRPGAIINTINIVTNDDASLGILTLVGTLSGASNIVVDGAGASFTADGINTTGRIRYGGDLTAIRVNGDFRQGQMEAKNAGAVSIGGSFGDPNTSLRNEASITLTNATSLDIDGNHRGSIVIAREINLINVDGGVQSALIRVGSRLGQLVAGSMSRTRVSVGDFLGGTDASSGNTGGNTGVQAVRIVGDMFDSSIMVGGDLGLDGEIGGQRLSDDRVSSGFLGSVFVGGDFEESDIVAGLLRGPDGFFGTTDDEVAAGRSSIGNVTIVGQRVGSNRFTESYRVASTGTLGTVSIGGQTGQNQLNFEISQLDFQPVELQITDISVAYLTQQFVATIQFNQAIDESTIEEALSIRDVRSGGNVQVFLIAGEDYTIDYNPATNSATVTFSRSVTESNLPVTPGRPALGTYAFVLDYELLRGSLSSARLDGDNDGLARGENFTGGTVIGDAGDKLTPGTANVVDNGNVVHTVDFYGPVNLNIVMDTAAARDGLPDVNQPYTIRGFIGDHADHDTDYFRFAGDTDIYAITLQAGQTLRLGSMAGSAQQAQRSIVSANGDVIYTQTRDALGRWTGGNDDQVTRVLSADDVDILASTIDGDFYIRESGTYYIVIGSPDAISDNGEVVNTAVIPNGLGAYSFSVEVYDDFDSGFAADTDAGDGAAIVNAPPVSAFTNQGQTIEVGGFTFRLSTDGQGNPIVIGTNGQGIESVNSGGVLTTTIESAIGPGNLAGVPNQIFTDIDVFHLNNRAGITPGTLIRVVLRTSGVGGDLGSKSVDNDFFPTDLQSRVQLGIFDTTTATNASNGQLYLSPDDFNGNGGDPNTLIADNGSTRYGYDANGDFFIEFVAAGRPGADGQTGTSDDTPASYAIYVQGAFNSDYEVEVTTSGTAQVVKNTQNIFIETFGGEVNWLETGGLVTDLLGFDLSALGFTGTNSTGVPVNEFVLQRIVTRLEAAFAQLGLDVNISTNSNEFEFQPFSTIFLTNSVDPVNLTFDTEYGYSEHSDALNADLEDEGVVFVSSFSSFQFTPDDSGLSALADALTAAVGRRAGELMGLRITEDTPTTGSVFDIMAANSPDRLFYPGNSSSWSYLQALRPLSNTEDSDLNNDFILGSQSSASLLEKVLLRN